MDGQNVWFGQVKKLIFYSPPVFGLCIGGDNLVYSAQCCLENYSKTRKWLYHDQKVRSKKSKGPFLKQLLKFDRIV